ncbi:hypothetical protein NECID01_1952 [Nematocida sp. AWRm77]|nr:hypothetical protein NECID01_1952 [Nematocida sp. AWRm77]
MDGETQPSTAIQALLTHIPLLKHLEIETDSADFPLAAALRNCSNLRTLNITVKNYTPGFLARYLKDPQPRLTSLTLHNNDTNHKYSEEDKEAEEDAEKKGMRILVL